MTAAGWDLVAAVDSALVVLGFFELGDDAPPPHLWHHEARLGEWFDALVKRRADPSLSAIPAADEQVDGMTGNEYAKAARS